MGVEVERPPTAETRRTPHRVNPIKFGPKPTLFVLAALTVLSLILRYPTNHERGVDSFTIHALSGLVLHTSAMGWMMSPLSYFGLAPFSYPPAVPVSLAMFASLSGLDVEAAGLVYSLLLGATITLTSFLLGHAALRSNPASLALAAVLSSSGGIVAFTNWNLSARGTFLVFVPLVLAFLVKVLREGQSRARRNTVKLVLACSPLIFVHFLWLLLVPLLLGVAIVFGIAKTHDSLLRRRMLEHSRARGVLVAQFAIGIAIFVMLTRGTGGFFSVSQFPELSSAYIPNTLLTRIGVEYATTMGITILAFPLGVWAVRAIPERHQRYALTSLIVSLVPFAIDPVYGILLATPIVLLVASIGLRLLVNSPRRLSPTRQARRAAAIAAGLSLSLLVPYLVTVPREPTIACNQPGSIDDQTYDAALYLRGYLVGGEFTFVSDDPLNSARVEAISGIPSVEPILSIGTLGYPWIASRNHIRFSPSQDLLGQLASEQQLLSVREWIPGASASYEYFAGKHTTLLLANGPDSPVGAAIRSAYNTEVAVQLCRQPATVFFAAVDDGGYLIYANPMQRTYLIP